MPEQIPDRSPSVTAIHSSFGGGAARSQLQRRHLDRERNRNSPIAHIVASALMAFESATPSLPLPQSVAMARRAASISTAEVHAKLKRGLSALATIASTSPFVGLFGTAIGILDAFKGCIGSRAMCLAMTAGAIAEALITTALGMLVAVPAVWCYNSLRDTLRSL